MTNILTKQESDIVRVHELLDDYREQIGATVDALAKFAVIFFNPDEEWSAEKEQVFRDVKNAGWLDD